MLYAGSLLGAYSNKLESATRPLLRGGSPTRTRAARRSDTARSSRLTSPESMTPVPEMCPTTLALVSRAITVAPESPASATAATSSRPSSVVSRRASHAPTISVESPRRNTASWLGTSCTDRAYERRVPRNRASDRRASSPPR